MGTVVTIKDVTMITNELHLLHVLHSHLMPIQNLLCYLFVDTRETYN